MKNLLPLEVELAVPRLILYHAVLHGKPCLERAAAGVFEFLLNASAQAVDVVDAFVEVAGSAGWHEVVECVDAIVLEHLHHFLGLLSWAIDAMGNGDDVVNLHFRHLDFLAAIGAVAVILVVHLLAHGLRYWFSFSVFHIPFPFRYS